MNGNNSCIIYLDWKNKEHVKAVSSLHMKLLPESILTKLGGDFLCKFYYSKLCKENLIDVYLYQWNNNYVGFISCTSNPFTFTNEGIKKYKFLIFILLLKSIIKKPIRFFNLITLLRDKSLSKYKLEDKMQVGQFLSFGVIEEFRKNIDNIEKITIPNVLMRKVFLHFRGRNKTFFLQVLKSNIPAIKFYEKYEGKIFNQKTVTSSYIVEFNSNFIESLTKTTYEQ